MFGVVRFLTYYLPCRRVGDVVLTALMSTIRASATRTYLGGNALIAQPSGKGGSVSPQHHLRLPHRLLDRGIGRFGSDRRALEQWLEQQDRLRESEAGR
jgi:hypothetical protein